MRYAIASRSCRSSQPVSTHNTICSAPRSFTTRSLYHCSREGGRSTRGTLRARCARTSHPPAAIGCHVADDPSWRRSGHGVGDRRLPRGRPDFRVGSAGELCRGYSPVNTRAGPGRVSATLRNKAIPSCVSLARSRDGGRATGPGAAALLPAESRTERPREGPRGRGTEARDSPEDHVAGIRSRTTKFCRS
jgi:hypothetical protein